MSDEATQMAPVYPDIPDLSGLTEDRPDPWENGWYGATILQSRSFTNRDTGAITTFQSGDEPAQKTGRNITAQVQVKRKNGDTLNARILVNYLPEHLTSASIGVITQRKEAQKAAKKARSEATTPEQIAAAETAQAAAEWGPLFRAFSALTQIGTLQRVAGVRQFVRNGNGGLDISPLFGKSLYVRLGDDDRNPKYKAIVDFSDAAPKKGTL